MPIRLRSRCYSIFAAAALTLVSSARAQPPVRLELRIVPQNGTPTTPAGAGVTDQADNVHDPITAAGQVRRFEVQYRIIDLIPDDAIIPAGLTSGQLNITTTLRGAQGTLARALLSRFEAQQAAGTPPAGTDLSGPAFAPFLGATGMHRPFRGGITAPAPNNNSTANGQANVDSDPSPTSSVPGPGNTQLNGITPLSLSQNDQNADGWYGLYSFTFTVAEASNASSPPGVEFRAEFVADPNTGNRFGYFTDGNPVPLNSPNAIAATATVEVVGGPIVGVCCLTDGSCRSSSISACTEPGALYAGDGSTCAPSPCEPGVTCCLPSGGCSLFTAAFCASQGGLPTPASPTCSPNPCDSPAACCLAAGGCSVLLPAFCTSQGGLSIPGSPTCSPTPCGPPYACCFPSFGCLIASTIADCTAAGGHAPLSPSCTPTVCCPAPVITGHPQSRVFTAPEPVSFAVAATHPGTLAYQWRRNGAALVAGPRFSGINSPTLTISPTEIEDAGSYDVLLTAPCGVALASAAGELTPCAQPVFTTSPLDAAVVAGSGAMLTVAASGPGTLIYQWRKNGSALADSARITGALTPTLAISPVVPADDGLYDCIVASQCGTAASAYAALVVTCPPGPLDCNGNGICDALEIGGGRDLTAPQPATDDRFGWSVSLDGNRALVGARTAGSPAGPQSGAAYVFAGGAEAWSLQAALSAPDGAPGEDFGSQVSLHGQWAMVSARSAAVGGAPGAGAVYVFRNTGGNSWSFFQKLTEPVPTGGAQFGHGLDIDADRAVIGSLHGPGITAGTGVVYVYRFNGINWAREATLASPDGAAGDNFGTSVAIDDPYLIVGAPNDSESGLASGSASVYFRAVGGWELQSRVRARAPEAGSTFGELVAISGDLAMVNCPRETVEGLASAGAVYAFRRTDTRWTQQRRLTAPTPAAMELFGFYLALEGDLAAMGGFQRGVMGVAQAGAVDIFKRRGNFWTRADRIDSPRPDPSGFFGYSLSASGGRLAAGSMRGSARLVPAAGWVRVFDLAALDCDDDGVPDVCQIAAGTATDADGNGIPDPCQAGACRADFNDSGTVTVQDIFDFLADYFSANLTADFNDSGVLSVQDTFDFLAAYFTGCP